MTSSSNWSQGKCPFCDMPTEECDCDEGLDILEDYLTTCDNCGKELKLNEVHVCGDEDG